MDVLFFPSFFLVSRFAALHAAMALASTRAVAEHGHRVAKTLSAAALTHWGWLTAAPARDSPAGGGGGGGRRGDSISLDGSLGADSTLTTLATAADWRPTFAVLTDREMLLYESVPWSLDVWTRPAARIPLLMTRSSTTLSATLFGRHQPRGLFDRLHRVVLYVQ